MINVTNQTEEEQKVKKRKVLSVVTAAACLAAMLVTGCGSSGSDNGGSDDSGKTTLTFGCFETDNVTSEVWDAIIKPFEEAHPDIKVEKVMATGDDRTAFWRTKLNSGEFPDIVIEASNLSSMCIFAEVPEDVQALINEDLLTQYDGKVIDVPMNIQYKGQCYYNKAVFEELGLQEPETYDDFVNICKTIKDAGKTPLMCGGTGDTWATGSMYWIAQGDTMLKNTYPDFVQGLAEGTYTWNNDVTQKVLSSYQDLVNNGYYYEGGLSLSYSQCADAFLKGDAAMLIDGSWMNATLDNAGNEDYGVFVIPAMDGSKIAVGNTATWAVYKDSKNQEAAWEFFKYLLTENTDGYAKWLAADGLFSTTKEPVTYEMGPVSTKYLENIEGYELTCETCQTTGDYIIPSGMQSFIDKSIQNIYSGADVSDELDSWDAEYQRLMDAQ